MRPRLVRPIWHSRVGLASWVELGGWVWLFDKRAEILEWTRPS